MRRLEHLKAMRAFEAAARHLSFTNAAAELCVTQGALSHHVTSLEAELGVKLFVRYHRAIALTTKGDILFRHLREAFDIVQAGVDQVAGEPSSLILRIKLPPTFAIRWLVPRLARLHALHDRHDVQITTSHRMVDFSREEIDVAIYSGARPPEGLISKRLFGEELTPVCSYSLLKSSPPLRHPRDLKNWTLLCSLNRPKDWARWLVAANVHDVDGNDGLKFENSALAYQAAIDNLGIAMAQVALVKDELKAGRLVRPFEHSVTTDDAYFIVYPRRSRDRAGVKLFEKWVFQEVEDAYLTSDPSVTKSGSDKAKEKQRKLG
jgi:LysR family glycine cleavage system transcriptional activator